MVNLGYFISAGYGGGIGCNAYNISFLKYEWFNIFINNTDLIMVGGNSSQVRKI